MSTGIILAGGRGSRLGPLAAQISKALVSVGQRPQIVNQIEYLRQNGCGQIVVVVSPDTQRQVEGVLKRAGISADIAVQQSPTGPVPAIREGLKAVKDKSDSVTVIFSDTVVTEEITLADNITWVGTGIGTNMRSWCWFDGMRWVDSIPDQKTATVFIGLAHFSTYVQLSDAVTEAVKVHHAARMHDGLVIAEIGMATLLNRVGAPAPAMFPSWQDIGDIESLIEARRVRFISREAHELELTDYGTIFKRGASAGQVEFMMNLKNRGIEVECVFPRVYPVDYLDPGEYEMEFIDMPTLAELWLYWPGSADTWTFILREVIAAVRPLWTAGAAMSDKVVQEWYVGKAIDRLAEWDSDLRVDHAKLRRVAERHIRGCQFVNGHGDLNFTNIMFSLNAGAVKLIDPRGTMIPLSYEYAKLAYSPVFAAVTHGLFINGPDSTYLLPSRTVEQSAFDRTVYREFGKAETEVCEAMIMLAATPLHSPAEARAFYNIAMEIIEAYDD
jgi:GTP:adenosylcobinamide-phosphate guanylyltransferase